MTAHKHADLMLQYAQDAMETDKPWERWEYSDTSRDLCKIPFSRQPKSN